MLVLRLRELWHREVRSLTWGPITGKCGVGGGPGGLDPESVLLTTIR